METLLFFFTRLILLGVLFILVKITFPLKNDTGPFDEGIY